MKALKIELDGASVIDIDNTLEALQTAVGDYIEAVGLFDDRVTLLCGESGKLKGLSPVLAIVDKDMHILDTINGTALLVGVRGEDFCSLTPEQIGKYIDILDDFFIEV